MAMMTITSSQMSREIVPMSGVCGAVKHTERISSFGPLTLKLICLTFTIYNLIVVGLCSSAILRTHLPDQSCCRRSIESIERRCNDKNSNNTSTRRWSCYCFVCLLSVSCNRACPFCYLASAAVCSVSFSSDIAVTISITNGTISSKSNWVCMFVFTYLLCSFFYWTKKYSDVSFRPVHGTLNSKPCVCVASSSFSVISFNVVLFPTIFQHIKCKKTPEKKPNWRECCYCCCCTVERSYTLIV